MVATPSHSGTKHLALYRVVDPTRIPGTLGNLGLVVFLQGDDARVREIEEEVLAHFRAADDDWNIVTSLNNLARVVRRQGDDAYAASLFGEGLMLGGRVGAAGILVDLVEKVAGMVAARGERDTAARLWGAAEAYRERIGAPMEPVPVPATSVTWRRPGRSQMSMRSRRRGSRGG